MTCLPIPADFEATLADLLAAGRSGDGLDLATIAALLLPTEEEDR